MVISILYISVDVASRVQWQSMSNEKTSERKAVSYVLLDNDVSEECPR